MPTIGLGRAGPYGGLPEDARDRISSWLASQFERGRLVPLTEQWAPRDPGVYGLYVDGELVYVGASDKLRDRLLDHQHGGVPALHGLPAEEVWCRWAPVKQGQMIEYVEQVLIDRFKPRWNSNFRQKPVERKAR